MLDVPSDSEIEYGSGGRDEKSELAPVDWMDDAGVVLTDQALLLDLAKDAAAIVEKRSSRRPRKDLLVPAVLGGASVHLAAWQNIYRNTMWRSTGFVAQAPSS